MSAKAPHSRKGHQHYLVQFTIEEIPPHGSPLTVGVSASTGGGGGR